MTKKKVKKIEKINHEFPDVEITPTFRQAVLISIGFFCLAIVVSFLAETL